ncbi:MAG: glycosyltransferase family 4 protein [Patescibacteria group bacterium]
MSDDASKLRVGLVLDDGLDSPDGVQQYVLAMGEWLRDQGHEVLYLAGQTSRTDIEGVHSLSRNISVKSNGNYLTVPLPTSRKKLRNFLAEHQLDVLHVQTPYSPFMAGRLVQEASAQTAVVGTFHILPNSYLISLGTQLLGRWSRRSLRRFDKMLSVSPAAQVFARDKFGVESSVLPNVIDYERFRLAKPLVKYNDSTLTILFLGRLVPRKGCHLLLEAVSELVNNHENLPAFRVVICGKGPLLHNLKRFVDERGLNDIVEFTGFVSEVDKPHYYAAANISAFPSSGGESFGIVLLEAMASGNSVVLAGDNAGYRSVMHEQPDLLFAPKDKLALADKLALYLNDATKHQAMSQWGARYTADFDVNKVGSKLVEIYREALRKRPKL